MEIYDFVLGLGTTCLCSQALRAANLQLTSFPFDWVGGRELSVKARHMVEGFPGWFEPGTLTLIDSPCKTALTTAWSDTLGYTPVHDFHRGIPLEEELPKVRAKYRRRIARMERLLNQSRRVLLVCVDMPNYPVSTPEEAVKARQVLQERWPKTEFDFLFFKNGKSPTVDAPSTDGIRIVTLPYLSGEANTATDGVEVIAAWLRDRMRVRDYRTSDERRTWKQKVRQRKYGEYNAKSFWGYCLTRWQYKIYRSLHKRLSRKGVI